MTGNNKLDVNDLSPHLFWDVDKQHLDIRKNKKFIVQRVLEYGLLNDWVLINKFYGLEEISSIAVKMRDLNERTLSFISLLSKIPEDQFLCYTTRGSTSRHWNF